MQITVTVRVVYGLIQLDRGSQAIQHSVCILAMGTGLQFIRIIFLFYMVRVRAKYMLPRLEICCVGWFRCHIFYYSTDSGSVNTFFHILMSVVFFPGMLSVPGGECCGCLEYRGTVGRRVRRSAIQEHPRHLFFRYVPSAHLSGSALQAECLPRKPKSLREPVQNRSRFRLVVDEALRGSWRRRRYGLAGQLFLLSASRPA